MPSPTNRRPSDTSHRAIVSLLLALFPLLIRCDSSSTGGPDDGGALDPALPPVTYLPWAPTPARVDPEDGSAGGDALDVGLDVDAAGDDDASSAGADGGADASADAALCLSDNADVTGAVNVDVATVFQHISGFGGANILEFIPDLTSDQIDTAFGSGDGQIGMTILRIDVPPDEVDFTAQVPTAAHAASLGAKVFATPWSPPPADKSNGSLVGGTVSAASFVAYADHLMRFRDFMANSGAPLYALSVQNEPDITVTYESCSWNASSLLSFIDAQGSRWGTTQLAAAESYDFDHSLTDPSCTTPPRRDSSASSPVTSTAAASWTTPSPGATARKCG
jgi:hypothetical protein